MNTKESAKDELVLGGLHICRPAPHYFEDDKVFGVRLMSDLHIGAANIDYGLIESELQEAQEKGDRILINGDLFDMILPKDAKRYQPANPHPRIGKRNDQINAAVQWALELLSPVAHQIDMIGIGNHEAKVIEWHSIDPTLYLVYELEKVLLERGQKHIIHYGGYSGFVDYRLRSVRSRKDKSSQGSRYIIYYHHGSGGDSPVTKGLIDFNRKDTWVDADLIWMGHKHNRLAVTVEKIRCPREGDEPQTHKVHHAMTGAYFDTYKGQSQASVRKHGRRSNYAADKGLAPGGKGGLRLEIEQANRPHSLLVRIIQ